MHAMVRWDLHYLETLDQLDLTVDPREVTWQTCDQMVG